MAIPRTLRLPSRNALANVRCVPIQRTCSAIPGSPSRRAWRQPEPDRRALIYGRFGFDVAAMPFHDPLNGREPDAVSGEFVLAMQTDERLKEPAGMRHVEARAVVGNAVPGAPVTHLGVETDRAGFRAAGVFPRVAK